MKDISFEDIQIGDVDSFERTWGEEEIEHFALVSGNTNPLHTNDEYAKSVNFKSKLIYGMHIAVVCSTFVGMYLPGKKCLCLRQSLDFKNPVYVGDTTLVTGTVISKSEATRTIEIGISVTIKDTEVVHGVMLVRVLS